MTPTAKHNPPAPGTLRVDLGARAYDILVGEDLINQAGPHMAAVMDQKRAIIVTDETVATLHLDPLKESLESVGIQTNAIVLPAGEATKDFGHLETLTSQLLDQKVERNTTLVALGGGVIGDLVGFAAAITLRGIPFIQVPTTLLSQVDSSVGGKTGINTSFGKNLVGAFYQPRLVLADTGVLNTLPKRQLLAGYAEVVKYGLINDADFFAWLEKNGTEVISGKADARRHTVLTCCAAKALVVGADEREHGNRALLNLGHTFGHALESETGYGDSLLHGEGVALGMLMAFDLSVRMGLCPAAEAERVRAHFKNVGLMSDLSTIPTSGWTPERLIGHMGQDKKVEAGRITFILVRGIGKAFITADVAMDDVHKTLENALQG